MNRPDWQEQALCAQVDGDLWFPEKGKWGDARKAQAICDRCPVRVPCAEAGAHERHGIWGGTTVEQREQTIREEAA